MTSSHFFQRFSAIAGLILLFFSGFVLSAPKKIVISIKPIHSLASALLEGIHTPTLFLEQTVSAHHHHMRPSDSRKLHEADLVVWVGPNLETFLTQSVSNLKRSTQVIQITSIPTLKRYPMRTSHCHHHHSEHHHHFEPDLDPHVWLDTQNAQHIVHHLKEAFLTLFPESAQRLHQNTAQLELRLKHLETYIHGQFAHRHPTQLMGFHDGYQYYEKQFQRPAPYIVSQTPHAPLSAKSISKAQQYIQQHPIGCLVSEPQIKAKTLKLITQGSSVQIINIDPLGNAFEKGPSAYFELLKSMTQKFVRCSVKKEGDN